MNETLQVFATNFGPWLTAIGAFTFGILSHKRSKKADEKDSFQKQLEQLHNLYHALVSDLSEQVERLTEQNEKLAETNSKLVESVDELTEENRDLKRTVRTLTTQVRDLKKQVSELHSDEAE